MPRGAPKGNQNAAKGKEWADAIKWALANFETSAIERGQALRAIGMKLVEKASEGDMPAVQEIGNRLDGKPTQSVSTGDEPMELVIRWGAPKS